MLNTRIPIPMTGVGLAALLAASPVAPAQDTSTQPDASIAFDASNPIWPIKTGGVDPTADRIIRAMSEHLAAAQSFTFKLEVTEDVLLDHGQMIQYGGVAHVAVLRPGSVHARFRGEERRSNVVIHDGRVVLHDLENNMYATAKVPKLIDDAVNAIVDKYGINVPAADLVSADPYAAVMSNARYGYVVGTAMVDGTECHHLAFAQDNIDWQVWIATGPEPVVRKLVITYKNEGGWPQYTARVSEWNLSPRLSMHSFDYEPPADAQEVEFLPKTDTEDVQ